jgi:hypothetical protein
MFKRNKALFPGQQENEEIRLVIREHWFHLFARLLIWVLFVVVLFAMDKYIPIYLPGLLADPFGNFYALFRNVYTIFMVLGLFMIWALYYLNVQIITNQRIVEVDQASLFIHRVSELDLSKIEDVTGETKGFFGNMFSYGNVYVQTAGKTERFAFQNIPHPDKVEKLILDLYQRYQPEARPETRPELQ